MSIDNPKFNHIFVDVYGRHVYWVICPVENFQKLIYNHFGKKVKKSKLEIGYFNVYNYQNDKVCVMWFLTDAIDIITHEVFHCTSWIMKYSNIKLSNSSEEAYAYLIQYIIQQMKL